MKVYIVRHGESESNRDDTWTGHLDVHLTEKGKDDALFARGVLSDVRFDAVYSSDLVRATETAEIALPAHKYVTDKKLREIDVGSITGQPRTAFTKEFKNEFYLNGYTKFGGESRDEMRNRVREFMHELENMRAENVAVFSHAGWLCAFLDVVLQIPVSRSKMICKNCAVGVFEYNGTVWKLHSWINPD